MLKLNFKSALNDIRDRNNQTYKGRLANSVGRSFKESFYSVFPNFKAAQEKISESPGQFEEFKKKYLVRSKQDIKKSLDLIDKATFKANNNLKKLSDVSLENKSFDLLNDFIDAGPELSNTDKLKLTSDSNEDVFVEGSTDGMENFTVDGDTITQNKVQSTTSYQKVTTDASVVDPITEKIDYYFNNVIKTSAEGYKATVEGINQLSELQKSTFNDISEYLTTIVNATNNMADMARKNGVTEVHNRNLFSEFLTGNLYIEDLLRRVKQNFEDYKLKEKGVDLGYNAKGWLANLVIKPILNQPIIGDTLYKANAAISETPLRLLTNVSRIINNVYSDDDKNSDPTKIQNRIANWTKKKIREKNEYEFTPNSELKHSQRMSKYIGGALEKILETVDMNSSISDNFSKENLVSTSNSAARTDRAFFDVETHLTINKIIPGYLSMILSTVTGEEAIYHDYASGQWVTRDAMKKKSDQLLKQASLYDNFGVLSQLENKITGNVVTKRGVIDKFLKRKGDKETIHLNLGYSEVGDAVYKIASGAKIEDSTDNKELANKLKELSEDKKGSSLINMVVYQMKANAENFNNKQTSFMNADYNALQDNLFNNKLVLDPDKIARRKFTPTAGASLRSIDTKLDNIQTIIDILASRLGNLSTAKASENTASEPSSTNKNNVVAGVSPDSAKADEITDKAKDAINLLKKVKEEGVKSALLGKLADINGKNSLLKTLGLTRLISKHASESALKKGVKAGLFGSILGSISGLFSKGKGEQDPSKVQKYEGSEDQKRLQEQAQQKQKENSTPLGMLKNVVGGKLGGALKKLAGVTAGRGILKSLFGGKSSGGDNFMDGAQPPTSMFKNPGQDDGSGNFMDKDLMGQLSPEYNTRLKELGMTSEDMNDPKKLADISYNLSPLSSYPDAHEDDFNRKKYLDWLKDVGDSAGKAAKGIQAMSANSGGSSDGSIVSGGNQGVPGDTKSFLKINIGNNFGCDENKVIEGAKQSSRVRSWLGSSNAKIKELMNVVRSCGMSPELFIAYDIAEQGTTFGWLNHTYRNGDAMNDARSVATWAVKQANTTGHVSLAWYDAAFPQNYTTPVSKQKEGQAFADSLPKGALGRMYLSGTAAATWGCFDPDALKASVNGVQNYGNPIEQVMKLIKSWGGKTGASKKDDSGSAKDEATSYAASSSSEDGGGSTVKTGGSKSSDSSSGSSGDPAGDSSNGQGGESGRSVSEGSSKIEKMISWGEGKIGKTTYSQYQRNGPSSYDCSSFVYYAMKEAGFAVPNYAWNTMVMESDADQNQKYIKWISASEIKRGDLFIKGYPHDNSGNKGHTGIFIDNGKNILHCTSSKNGVCETPYSYLYMDAPIRFARIVSVGNGSDSGSSGAAGGSSDDEEELSKAYTRFTEEDAEKFMKEFQDKLTARYGKEIEYNKKVFEDAKKAEQQSNSSATTSQSGSAFDNVAQILGKDSQGNIIVMDQNGNVRTITNKEQLRDLYINGLDGKLASPNKQIPLDKVNALNKILDTDTAIEAVLYNILKQVIRIKSKKNPKYKVLLDIVESIKTNNSLTATQSELVAAIEQKMPTY